MKMTVYVTQEPRPNKKSNWVPDLTSASQYGALKYIFNSDDHVSKNREAAFLKASRILEDFNPEEDYLLETPSVDPGAHRIAIMYIMAQGFSNINFMTWERIRDEDGEYTKKGIYIPVSYCFND